MRSVTICIIITKLLTICEGTGYLISESLSEHLIFALAPLSTPTLSGLMIPLQLGFPSVYADI